MGSLAVLAMVDKANPSHCKEQQPLHPFFQLKRQPISEHAELTFAKDTPEPPSTDNSMSSFDEPGEDRDSTDSLGLPVRKNAKRLRQDSETGADEKQVRQSKCNKISGGGNIADHFARLLQRNNIGGVPGGDDAPQDERTPAFSEADERPNVHAPADGGVAACNNILPGPPQLLLSAAGASLPRPTKMIQFNPKTGTIGSPPKAKGEAPGTGGKGGVAKKGASAAKLVRIKYGTDPASRARIGGKIRAILEGSLTKSTFAPELQREGESQADIRSDHQKSIGPQSMRAVHPFFLSKTKAPKSTPAADAKISTPEMSKDSSRIKFSATPCSPQNSRQAYTPRNMPQFGARAAVSRMQGLKLPAWPSKGASHVRGEDDCISQCQSAEQTLPFASRKSKGRSVSVSDSESILRQVCDSLRLPTLMEATKSTKMDGISPPPSTIRLPHRYFESGSKLQQRILPELRCSNRRKFDGNGNRSMEVEAVEHPPQLIRLFRSIRSELPAVDRSECETVSWAQKYCPISAAEVLQQGREAFMLKEWLQRLMVQAVDTGSGESGERKRLGSAKRLNSTKKRKKQLGDFIVSSGEEDDGYDELSEGEGDWGASGVHGIVKKTVVRSGDLRAMESKSPPYRLANTVVISGPHGSGKTAAVYAVAKELGFEVFEINSGSRRSGKDVLERIGDMTQNHLVSNQHSSVPGSGEDAADAIQEDDIAKEIKAGKQQTMGSFFSSKRASHLQKPTTGVLAGAAHTTAKKDVPKGQKQSLILLDEADILYEEDKQFWTTVTNLIAQSKRPFVMTCNDEALLPLQNLTLHGIFRFSHPPIDLAVDRLVLIAANEGHALRRVAVEALYESRNRDLRAATMDLNYWCQIGVGDRRGGFDWFYLRWPKGIDLDENKEVVRVVSGDTYQEGMNWVGHDHAVDSASDPRCVEDELLQQIRDFWDVDTSSWQLTTGVSAWAESVEDIARDPGGRLACLDAYHKFAEAMSASDIGSCRSWSKFKLDPIDPTLPKLASRVRDDYILGLQLLEAEPAIHYDPTLSSLPYTLRSMARQVLNLSTSPFSHAVVPELGPLTEDRVVSIIGHHFTSTPEDAPAVSRIDFALAFDPIAASDSPQYFSALTYLDPSVFDRTLELITLDVAPYVRSIVAYDVELQKRRSRLSSLLSEGGRKTANAKRMRTTRAAYSALEGGSRSTTRGERWFKADLNPYLVSKTAGQGWTQLVLETISARMAEEAEEGDQSRHGRRRRKEMRNVLKNDSDDEA